MTYLADTSTIVRLRRQQDIAPRWVDAIRGGLPAVEAELVRAVGSKREEALLRQTLDGLFAWHPMPDRAWTFVQRTQADLISAGKHKGPSVVDLLVAATADAWDLTVLHVDADFDTIASVTGLRTQRADHPR